MSGARLTVRLDTREVRGATEAWRRLMRDPARLWQAIGPRLVSNTQDRFDDETAPDGAPWSALSPAYAPIKQGPGMLRVAGMRGGLQGSITFDTAGSEIAVGSNKAYAGVHQFGATIRAKHAPALRFRTVGGLIAVRSVRIPARPYLGLSAKDEEDIFDAVEFLLLRARPAG